MESTETFNFDFERVGSSRRRISSILKAPRTSVKVTESSLKEPQQGEKSKPTEKRRSSRRVSFAATKNVVVFAKDITSSSEEQSPSPSLTPMGADSQDAKVTYDGIENLLKAPLQVSHQMDENQFFPDVFLPDSCNDKTVQFGEDTACMDMTHCHTVLIDKESDKSGLNFTINTEMSVSRICKPTKMEDAVLQKNVCLVDKENAYSQNAEPDSDFGAFLASMSQQKGVGNKSRNESPYMVRDQTLLFGGDDTAHMDMTHSHTVMIDDDSNETDLNFTKRAEMPVSGIFKTINKEDNIPQRNVELAHKAATDGDFEVFLASLTKPKGLGNAKNEETFPAIQPSSVPFHNQKVDSNSFFARLNARSVVNKENQPPALSDLSVSKPQGLSLRRSTTPSAEHDFMDLTKSHTVAIDRRGCLQSQQATQREKQWAIGQGSTNVSKLYFDGLVGSLKSPDPDDMDLTRSQTVAINFKSMDVVSERSFLDPNQTQIFSANNVGMELTGVIDGTEVQENIPQKMRVQTEKRFSLSKPRGAFVHTAQPVSQQQRISHFQNDMWTVDLAKTDDMELTKSQTVVIDSKGYERDGPNKIRKSLSATRSLIFAQNGEGREFTEPFTGHMEARERGSQSASMDMKINQTGTALESDGMEMTTSQTVVIDSKAYRQEKPVRSRKSLSTNRSVMFAQNDDGMEMTEALSGHIEADSYSNRIECDTRSVSMDLNINQNVPDNGKSLWAVTSDSNDMEMTKSQTVVIDSKDYNQVKAPKSRKSLSTNKSVLFSKNDDCMEMTEALTGHIDANRHSVRDGTDQTSPRVFLNQTVQQSQPHVEALCSEADDMEITRSQTVVIDSKAYKQGKPVRSRKSLSTNRSVMFAQNDDGMEMTEALSGHIEADSYSNRIECDTRSVSMDLNINQNVPDNGKSLWAVTSDSNDMEMTKSQTVVIDSKDYNQVKAPKSRKSLSTNKSVLFSKNDDCMEMTEALRHSVRDGTDQTSPRVFLNQTVQQSQPHVEALCSEADDMEITRSQTVVIDSKNRGITGNGLSHSSQMEIAESQKDLTESSQPIKESLLRESMMKSLPYVPSSLQNTMFGNDPYSERQEATTVSGDDMEITRSQTVVIDAKNKRMSGDSDPKVHTLTTKWKNSILPMTATFPSSQMASQASVLQMSTAGEDMGFTTHKAAAMDSDPSEVNDGYKSTTKKFFPLDPLISNPCESEGITTDLSFITGQKVFPSLGVDDMELTSSKHVTADSQVTRKSVPYMAAESKTQCSSDEGYILKMTKSAQLASDERYGALLHEEDPVALMSQSREVFGESSSVRGRDIHHGKRSSLCTEEKVDSAEPDPVSPPDHTVTKRIDPISQKSKSRRKSLLDLQSKLRRISQTFNDPAQSVVNSATVPLPRLEVTEKFTENPEMADPIGCSNQETVEVLTEQPDHVESSRMTSLDNHETKPLTARLSYGGFLPKLPSRPKPIITDHVSETTKTFKSNLLEINLDATSNPGNSEMDGFLAEQLPEMSIDEDISGAVDDYSFKQTQEEEGHCDANQLPEDLVHNVSPTLNVTKNLKRPRLEDDHDNMPLEQKRKQEVLPTEVKGSALSSNQWETNATEEASNVMTKTIDGTSSSSNSTYIKSEATFESTYKYSQCDSQIDRNLDYESDFYKKIEDGSITVNEFLRHFGIDIVIYRSRPSALPDNFSPDPTPKMEHLLKELFIYRPKQRVYEADCEKLAAMVEGLKSRMLEQDCPLRHINESLGQELTNLSEEQLLSFGSKLKERKVHFRKRSKMLSHEMKFGMYSELLHTTQVTKHKLEEKVLETDTVLKDLDACIHDLEVELEAVDSALRVDQVHAQSEKQPALRERQEELERLDSAVAEKQRQMVHVESEKKNKAEQLDRLQEGVKDIKKHTSVLHSVNEWKLSLKENGRTLFGFLHNTLLLEVVHQPPNEMLAPNDTEQKVLDVSFNFQSDDKSECHSIMVHDLLSQLFKSGWLKRYSTTRDIPMLLHDVSLGVSRIRLLGEEIHRLKRWGALRLSVLEISCADRKVQIVFSSLKAFVKFQLTLMVTCAYPFGGIKVHSFQNYIGNTSVDQIEDVLSSIEPAKGYLTKFIKMIHDHLLV